MAIDVFKFTSFFGERALISQGFFDFAPSGLMQQFLNMARLKLAFRIICIIPVGANNF